MRPFYLVLHMSFGFQSDFVKFFVQEILVLLIFHLPKSYECYASLRCQHFIAFLTWNRIIFDRHTQSLSNLSIVGQQMWSLVTNQYHPLKNYFRKQSAPFSDWLQQLQI